MTQSREVLAMMDTHTTTFGRKRGCTISRCGAVLLGAFFLMSLVATGFLVYHFAPCLDGESTGRVCDLDKDNAVLDSARKFTVTGTKRNYDVRLPRSVVPEFYELRLTPFIWEGNFTFHGEVKIIVNVTENTKNVSLHAVDLKIDRESTRIRELGGTGGKSGSIEIADQFNDTERQFHVIRTSETLTRGKQYVVHLKFIGNLNNNLRGFYRSSYTIDNETRWIATTQFQPTDARRAFPCFDEPALKARYQISIARPKNMTSISNMPSDGKVEPVDGLDWYVWDHYEKSVPMSTYLVAFIVSDFKSLESESQNFRVWARSKAINQARYSLMIGPKILKYYEDYFKIKFPLPKMDMVALPDFLAGAMENWGLITYRETAMLYEDGISTNSNKQRVANVVAHELAHQWFGNLVTPSWWTDLWLNEGFASYVEYLGMDAVEPEWRVLEQFVVHDVQNVFALDALESSHPISIQVRHPDEIDEIFDRISYGKGASIIRMMDHFLTTEVFKRGLTNYLNAKAYKNAEQDDLWDALTKEAHKSSALNESVTVKQIMDTWTLQTGFPVVNVIRNYNTGGATLTQNRFMLRNNSVSNEKPLWWIPITYATEANPNFNKTRPSHWMNAEKHTAIANLGASPSQWVIFNILETGYYRVNYDKTNWKLIIKQLNRESFREIPTINRAQLIDDALNLARAGKLDYETALDVTLYLANETEYLPWKAAFTAMGYLDSMLIKLEAYSQFREYILKLLANVYKQVGFIDESDDSQLTVFTRIDVLNWACGFGLEDCVRNAATQFQNWRSSPNPDDYNPISPNLKSVVYCTAIRVGGQTEWDFAWQRYLNTNVGSEKDLLLHALGCTKEVWILSRYLDMTIKENSGIRKQDVSRVFAAVANNVIGQPLAFDYFRNNWSRLRKYFGASFLTVTNIIKSATKGISTRFQLKDLMDFANEHKEELSSGTRTIQQAVEQAESNIYWTERNHAAILNWLKQSKIQTGFR